MIVRTGLASIIVLRLVFRDWWLLSTTPGPLFDPVFAASWMSGPPSRLLVTVLWAVGLAGAIACVLGVRTHLAFIVAWVAHVELCAMWSSSGKVMHNDVLLLWACVPFLFAAAPRRHQLDEVDERWGWAPRSSLAIIAAIYFLAGVQKLRHSGLEWVFSDNLSWVLRQGQSPLGAEISRDVAAFTWLTIAAAGTSLAFEVGAPVLLALRHTRAIFAVVMGLFHLSIWFLLGLDYYGWILTLVVVILPQAPLPRAVTARISRRIGAARLPSDWRPDRASRSGRRSL